MWGTHYVLTPEMERSVLAAGDNSETWKEVFEELDELKDVSQLEEEFKEREEEFGDLAEPVAVDAYMVCSNGSWDPIQRCLTDGTLNPGGGDYPLSHAILGGRHLHDEGYVVYVSAAEVRDVAEALLSIDEPWFRRKFDAIDEADYEGTHDWIDFTLAWAGLEEIRDLYNDAASVGLAVLFTAN